MSRLRENIRARAIGMLKYCVAEIHVTCHFNGHVSAIARLHDRFNWFGSVKDLPKSVLPRVTAEIQGALGRVTHLSDRFLSAKYTANITIGTQA